MLVDKKQEEQCSDRRTTKIWEMRWVTIGYDQKLDLLQELLLMTKQQQMARINMKRTHCQKQLYIMSNVVVVFFQLISKNVPPYLLLNQTDPYFTVIIQDNNSVCGIPYCGYDYDTVSKMKWKNSHATLFIVQKRNQCRLWLLSIDDKTQRRYLSSIVNISNGYLVLIPKKFLKQST